MNLVIKSVLNKYSLAWKEQNKIFLKAGRENPYLNPKFIILHSLTSEEKAQLIALEDDPINIVLYKIHELLERFSKTNEKELSYKKAALELKYKYFNKIPIKDTIDFRTLYYSIPSGINKPPLTFEEVRRFYMKGLIPHLYWNKGRPRFDRRMWFIVDFVLREAKEEGAIAPFVSIRDWSIKWIHLSNYLKIINFMYNSWNLGECVMDYADNFSKKQGWKNEQYQQGSRVLRRKIWVNEGTVIAKKLVESSGLVGHGLNLLDYYRDVFALLSFEAFPSNTLIDMYHNKNQRLGVMFGYETKMRLRTYNFDSLNINTYAQESLSDAYRLLFSAMDWGLSMAEGVQSRRVSDVVNLYRRKSDKNNKKPCRICGQLFLPKRKIDVTCGKRKCIQENKNLSKRKLPSDSPPIYPK